MKVLEARVLVSAPLLIDHWTPWDLSWAFLGQQTSSELWLGPGPRIPQALNPPYSTHLGGVTQLSARSLASVSTEAERGFRAVRIHLRERARE